ncbi:MAG: hypothetical protein SF339_01020 [Blastocatellia bacterium]|nr:hypothetical protein [Blastocatellia bacterium]
MKNELQENLIHRYLLGDLPEAEREALEAQWFSDSDAFERVWESENRLVDGYVRGRLSADERARFESHYLASPVHRRRVEAARQLLAAADAQAPEREMSFLGRIAAWFRLSPIPQYALAAGVLLAAGAIFWLLRERGRMRSEHELRIAAERIERERVEAELDRLKRERPPTQPQPQPTTPAAPTATAPRTVFSFLLSPTSVRGGAGQPLTLPAGTDLVQLRLRVDPGEWVRFEAAIHTADRAPVWRGRNLRARDGIVTLALPAARLPHNDYILTLSGAAADGRVEEINRYSFRILRE